MREFWGNQYDFNDRNDYPTRGFMMTAPNPRPKTTGGGFAFGNVNASGATHAGLRPAARAGLGAHATKGTLDGLCGRDDAQAVLLRQLDDLQPRRPGVPARRARLSRSKNYDFLVLIKELFASPLVTGIASDADVRRRRDAGQHRAARSPVCCAVESARASQTCVRSRARCRAKRRAATARIASSVAADAFSRGAESPITPSDPTLFYRAATEMLCENVANQVVDGPTTALYTSSGVAAALPDMVERLMGYPPSHPKYAAASEILKATTTQCSHKTGATTLALRSAFVLACESPTALGIGL